MSPIDFFLSGGEGGFSGSSSANSSVNGGTSKVVFGNSGGGFSTRQIVIGGVFGLAAIYIWKKVG